MLNKLILLAITFGFLVGVKGGLIPDPVASSSRLDDDNWGAQRGCCMPGQSCWPSSEDVDALAAALGNATIHREVVWQGGDAPEPMGVPDSKTREPFYGISKNMSAVYVQPDAELYGTPENATCFSSAKTITEYCVYSLRNMPRHSWSPAFVVFPTTTEHVQMAVKFARKHNLCLNVAGASHEFNNKHSNHRSLMIRTVLLKDFKYQPNDERHQPKGTIKVGSGMVFGEILKKADANGVTVSSGYGSTVGIVGWSLGGGHGPQVPDLGLGVDNVVELEVVDAKGNVKIVNAEGKYADLFEAMRGGAGSTWGVVTSITVRAHPLPKNGYQVIYATIYRCMEVQGKKSIGEYLKEFFNIGLTLDRKWSVLSYITNVPVNSKEGQKVCPGQKSAVTHKVIILYRGDNDTDAKRVFDKYDALRNDSGFEADPSIKVYMGRKKSWIDFWLGETHDYEPISVIQAGFTLPSGLVSREQVSSQEFAKYVISRINQPGVQLQIFQDLTGNINSDQPKGTSISAGLRSGFIHMIDVTNPEGVQTFCPQSYINESQYGAKDAKERFWGKDVYDKLLATKRKYDPENMFWCDYCIGSDLPRSLQAQE
eukprot:Nk52_evm2s392 gene=Nk52_evmTU2s392